ncbi:FUSC family protein [Pontibacter beigongshangensis]|uniref:FUSC family protein n=1 Tax=Pontibacter beigongshangensis TaxID=2574733 RepID=UPI00164F460D|nr:aromatic acid exporter family protein [Pontibacter beigongshangensis]
MKTALAAAISWFLATTLLQDEYPFFAPLAAVLTVQVTVVDSLEKASHRLVGIIMGVMLSMLIGHWFNINTYSIFFVILVGMTLANALRMNPQIVSQVGVSSLLVLAFGHSHGYATGRITETVVGSVVAIAINALIVPRNAIPDVEQAILRLSEKSAATLTWLARILKEEVKSSHYGKRAVDDLVVQTEKCIQTLRLAEQSLKYNPFLVHKRTSLGRLAIGIRHLEHITVQLRGIRRGLADIKSVGPIREEFPQVEGVAAAMEATAACIPIFGKIVAAPSVELAEHLGSSIKSAMALQTSCLADLREVRSLMVLRDMGSILTDLSRILKEVER